MKVKNLRSKSGKRFALNRRTYVLLASSFLALVLISCGAYLELKKQKVKPQALQVIKPLTQCSETEAVALSKPNTIRVENKIDDKVIMGTGFFEQDGYILTNSHIVDRKGKIRVYYPNGKSADAIIVANDIPSDVALLAAGKSDLLAFSYGKTSSLKEPQTLLGIGFAYNLPGEATVTKGAFSARRSLGGIEYLQTDAALSPGNSGGPLIDDCGNLAGMNSLSSDNATINLAISSESLQAIVNKLKNEKVISYVSGTRAETILSGILKNIGFEYDDPYNEGKPAAETVAEPAPSAATSPSSAPKKPSTSAKPTVPPAAPVTPPAPAPKPPVTSIPGLRKISLMNVLEPTFSKRLNKDVVRVGIQYLSETGADLSITYPRAGELEFNADVMVYMTNFGERIKTIYSGHFANSQIGYMFDGTNWLYKEIVIPRDELAVSDSDYADNMINCSVDLTIHTPEQGSFSGSGFGILRKY